MLSTRSSLIVLCITCMFATPTPQHHAQQGSQLRERIARIADSLSSGHFESENLNMMGREPILSDQFRRFAFLADSATTEELYTLTHHKSPVVRCYAFDALAYRHPSGFLKFLDQQLADTARFQTRFFDVGGFSTVSAHLVESTASIYLRNYVPDSAEYSFIRKMAGAKRVPNALIALAQYRRPQDADLIGTYLDEPRWSFYGIQAITRFPLESFFSRLKQLYEEQLSRPLPSLEMLIALYEAIVQYHRPEVLSMLNDALSLPDDYAVKIHRVALSVAFSRHSDNYFDSVRKKITLSKNEQDAVQELLAHPE